MRVPQYNPKKPVDHSSLISNCDIETFRAGGRGGQHQNKTESGVRIRHRPTGVTVVCRDERSQHQNKRRAFSVLQKRIKRLTQKKKQRISTTIPLAGKVKRRETKRIRAKKKQMRKRPCLEE